MLLVKGCDRNESDIGPNQSGIGILGYLIFKHFLGVLIALNVLKIPSSFKGVILGTLSFLLHRQRYTHSHAFLRNRVIFDFNRTAMLFDNITTES